MMRTLFRLISLNFTQATEILTFKLVLCYKQSKMSEEVFNQARALAAEAVTAEQIRAKQQEFFEMHGGEGDVGVFLRNANTKEGWNSLSGPQQNLVLLLRDSDQDTPSETS